VDDTSKKNFKIINQALKEFRHKISGDSARFIELERKIAAQNQEIQSLRQQVNVMLTSRGTGATTGD